MPATCSISAIKAFREMAALSPMLAVSPYALLGYVR
jgi:hypothetical protein